MTQMDYVRIFREAKGTMEPQLQRLRDILQNPKARSAAYEVLLADSIGTRARVSVNGEGPLIAHAVATSSRAVGDIVSRIQGALTLRGAFEAVAKQVEPRLAQVKTLLDDQTARISKENRALLTTAVSGLDRAILSRDFSILSTAITAFDKTVKDSKINIAQTATNPKYTSAPLSEGDFNLTKQDISTLTEALNKLGNLYKADESEQRGGRLGLIEAAWLDDFTPYIVTRSIAFDLMRHAEKIGNPTEIYAAIVEARRRAIRSANEGREDKIAVPPSSLVRPVSAIEFTLGTRNASTQLEVETRVAGAHISSVVKGTYREIFASYNGPLEQEGAIVPTFDELSPYCPFDTSTLRTENGPGFVLFVRNERLLVAVRSDSFIGQPVSTDEYGYRF
ncbi:hypothetical protein HY990_05595 [Candidatus Micrarchaeota archaeon]|nr:hypothetical protein [Candidatus Micrarchaeota archaeon]